jgi:hypothetical protein
MNTGLLPSPISLRRPYLLHLTGNLSDRFEQLWIRIRAWHAERAESSRCALVERELLKLSARTLRDIGAPEGLIGQKVWREALEAELHAFKLQQLG